MDTLENIMDTNALVRMCIFYKNYSKTNRSYLDEKRRKL